MSVPAPEQPIARAATKIFCKVRPSTYVENVAGQVPPLFASACRLRFDLSGAYVTQFAALTGSLKRQHLSQVAGFAAVAVAATVFTGWWVSLPLLSSWGWGLPAMRPLGALCLAALGIALVHPRKDSRLTFAVGLAA